jgi:endonuclease YncB( thermonuclease family)
MKQKSKRIAVAAVGLALLISTVLGHQTDDWAALDHRSFKVTRVESADTLEIQVDDRTESVRLLGVNALDIDRAWLAEHVAGQNATLLLDTPQTRDPAGRIRAFVFLANQNLSVELVKAGLAYADRSQKTVMDGLLRPAQSEAKKKKRGVWSR